MYLSSNVSYSFHIYLDNVFHGNQIYIYMYNCIPSYSIFPHSSKDVLHMDLVYLLNITDVLIVYLTLYVLDFNRKKNRWNKYTITREADSFC